MTDEIFEPYDRLITINICGRDHQVPENNSILRGLQYLDMETVSCGDFCWNGECLNCCVGVAVESGGEKTVIACRAMAQDGMQIVRLDPKISDVFSGGNDRT